MTLDKLEIGNVIETKDGSLFVAKKGEVSFFECVRLKFYELTNNHSQNTYFTNANWNDNLTFAGCKRNLDVIKVYEDYTLKNVLFEAKEPLLTETEKLYLRRIVSHYKEHIIGVSKVTYDVTDSRPTNTYIKFLYAYTTPPTPTDLGAVKVKKLFEIPVLEDKMKFANLEKGKTYTLKELDLD